MPRDTELDRLAADLWRWAAPHPEWRAGEFGAVVGSYAIVDGDDLLLIDPLVPNERAGEVLAELDELAEHRRVSLLVTIGYHVRSVEPLAERYDAGIWGPATLSARLERPERLTVLEPGEEGPAGVSAHAIGKPRRGERPLWIPSQRAIVFGDALVATTEGALRMWSQKPVDDRVRRHYAEAFGPSLLPLVELGPKRILVTHGAPVLAGGQAALRRAIDAGPWYHAG